MAKKPADDTGSEAADDDFVATVAKPAESAKSDSAKPDAKKSDKKKSDDKATKKTGKGGVKLLGPKTVAKPCLVGAALLAVLQVALPR